MILRNDVPIEIGRQGHDVVVRDGSGGIKQAYSDFNPTVFTAMTRY